MVLERNLDLRLLFFCILILFLVPHLAGGMIAFAVCYHGDDEVCRSDCHGCDREPGEREGTTTTNRLVDSRASCHIQHRYVCIMLLRHPRMMPVRWYGIAPKEKGGRRRRTVLGLLRQSIKHFVLCPTSSSLLCAGFLGWVKGKLLSRLRMLQM